jgi:hypothetical protein
MGRDDLVAFLIEAGYPIAHTCRPVAGCPPNDLRHFEELSDLSVGQLDEEISEELSSGFADARIA